MFSKKTRNSRLLAICVCFYQKATADPTRGDTAQRDSGTYLLVASAEAKHNAQRRSEAPLFACGVFMRFFFAKRLSAARRFSFALLLPKKKADYVFS